LNTSQLFIGPFSFFGCCREWAESKVDRRSWLAEPRSAQRAIFVDQKHRTAADRAEAQPAPIQHLNYSTDHALPTDRRNRAAWKVLLAKDARRHDGETTGPARDGRA
jgi:hypothetical protein